MSRDANMQGAGAGLEASEQDVAERDGWNSAEQDARVAAVRAARTVAEQDARVAADRSEQMAVERPGQMAFDRPEQMAVERVERPHAHRAEREDAARAECAAAGSRLAAFRCPDCDARYVAREANTTATCPWCGSCLQPAGHAREAEVPDFAVPFFVTRQQAMESLNKFVRNTWFVPDGFEVEVVRAQAIYVPYWLFGARAWETLTILDRTHGSGAQSYWGACQSARATYGDLAVSASRIMPPFYMEAAGLFYVDDLHAPSEAFAGGVVTEVPDAPANEMADRASEIASGMLHDWLLSNTTHNTGENLGYDWCKGLSVEQIAISRGVEIVERKGEARITDWCFCALPVWLLHCMREGEETLFVVNGQTGACAGSLAVDNAKTARDASPGFELRIAIGIVATLVLVYLCWRSLASQPTLGERGLERVAGTTMCFVILWTWVLHAAPVRSAGTHYISVREMAEGSRVIRPTSEQRVTACWRSKRAGSPKCARRRLEERMGSRK